MSGSDRVDAARLRLLRARVAREDDETNAPGLRYRAVILSVLPKTVWTLDDGLDAYIDLRSLCEAMGLHWPLWCRFSRAWAASWDEVEERPTNRPSARAEPCFDRKGRETELLPAAYFLGWLDEIERPLQDHKPSAARYALALRRLGANQWPEAISSKFPDLTERYLATPEAALPKRPRSTKR